MELCFVLIVVTIKIIEEKGKTVKFITKGELGTSMVVCRHNVDVDRVTIVIAFLYVECMLLVIYIRFFDVGMDRIQ